MIGLRVTPDELAAINAALAEARSGLQDARPSVQASAQAAWDGTLYLPLEVRSGPFAQAAGLIAALPQESYLTAGEREARQLLMVANIKAERDARRYEGGVQVDGRWFLSTRDAQAEYTSISTIARDSDVPADTVMREAWRTMAAGVTVAMTPALARQILAAGLANIAAIDDASQAHISAMLAATDPLAYDYSAGWPPHFQP